MGNQPKNYNKESAVKVMRWRFVRYKKHGMIAHYMDNTDDIMEMLAERWTPLTRLDQAMLLVEQLAVRHRLSLYLKANLSEVYNTKPSSYTAGFTTFGGLMRGVVTYAEAAEAITMAAIRAKEEYESAHHPRRKSKPVKKAVTHDRVSVGGWG